MRKFFKIFGIVIGALVLIIGGYLLYFHFSHTDAFYPKTYINGINVSNSRLDIAESLIQDSVLNQDFLLKADGEEIAVLDIRNDIQPSFEFETELTKVKTESDSLNLWQKLTGTKEYQVELNISVDRKHLEDLLRDYDFMKGENQKEPQNAFLDYSVKDMEYYISPEITGSIIEPEKLYTGIQDKLKQGIFELDFVQDEVYQLPEIQSDNEELVQACEDANNYLNTTITYQIGDQEEVLDRSRIQEFFSVSDENVMILNEETIRAYVSELAEKYDSVGKTRTFASTLRGNVIVSGGDYGYKIDQDGEMLQLTEDLKTGKEIEREPVYSQTAPIREENDIGTTYVEVDLTNQHIWFYYEGTLIVEDDCVTGTAGSHDTPPGVYTLKYKEADAVLRGDKQEDGSYGYEQPVDFWMPFNGGIGLHDASWRSSFGGTIYQTNGSHGCVNLPYDTAEIIFEKIEEGTPIVCYS